MGLVNLEKLLLKPGSSELSYGYIESTVIKRISAGNSLIHDLDSTSDLIKLLVLAMQRAGNGWVVVVSKRIFHKIVLPLLRACSGISESEGAIVDSLALLIECFPVIVRSNLTLGVGELERLLNLSNVLSVDLLSLVRAYSSLCELNKSTIHLILTKTLGTLASCQSAHEASLCLCILLSHLTSVQQDRQIWNTTTGLAANAARKFQHSREVRCYYRELHAIKYEPTEQSQINPSSAEISVAVEKEDLIEPTNSVEVGVLMEISSPRSSCPSLDL